MQTKIRTKSDCESAQSSQAGDVPSVSRCTGEREHFKVVEHRGAQHTGTDDRSEHQTDNWLPRFFVTVHH